MENTLETTTAKAIAGRLWNNGVGLPQMYIDTLMITRILYEWGLPEDLALPILKIEVQDTHEHIPITDNLSGQHQQYLDNLPNASVSHAEEPKNVPQKKSSKLKLKKSSKKNDDVNSSQSLVPDDTSCSVHTTLLNPLFSVLPLQWVILWQL